MDRVLVVGSGASGVHFALSLLERGHHVTMVDGGLSGRAFPLADAGFWVVFFPSGVDNVDQYVWATWAYTAP